MRTPFLETATQLNNSFISGWKKQGGKIVGYTCSYLPGEILQAMQILPYRIRGMKTRDMSIGDAYFGPYVCSFPKCVLQLAAEKKYKFLDGIIITPGCDSMRRLDDCWRSAGKEQPEIVTSFFHYFHVPHKKAEYSYQWFVQEIKKLVQHLEREFACQLSFKELRKTMEIFNAGRSLYRKLENTRCTEEVGLKGKDAFATAIAATSMPRKDFNFHLDSLIKTIASNPPFQANGHKRLMVIGSISDDLELIKLVEKDGQAVVVQEHLCFGAHLEGPEIETQASDLDGLISNLARAYLGRSRCPRMFGLYNERLNYLLDKIKRADVQGVIMQNIRFCDLHGSENGLLERDLEKRGIPCLKLEREYGTLVDRGRLKMRIDAFLERLVS